MRLVNWSLLIQLKKLIIYLARIRPINSFNCVVSSIDMYMKVICSCVFIHYLCPRTPRWEKVRRKLWEEQSLDKGHIHREEELRKIWHHVDTGRKQKVVISLSFVFFKLEFRLSIYFWPNKDSYPFLFNYLTGA